MAKALLITGATGYVGAAAAQAALAAGYAVTGTHHTHRPGLAAIDWRPLDVSDRPAVAELVATVHPAAIIHAAAAWHTPAEAQSSIVRGTEAVAAAAAAVGARLIHLSSDMVFDGEHAPYREGDPPAPTLPYGRAKAEAEGAVQAVGGDYVIVRTSLVTCFDPPDPRTEAVIASLRDGPGEGQGLVLFTDEYRCPVRTADLAAALVELIAHPYRGILHVAGPERLSRFELGQRIAAACGLEPARLLGGTAAGHGMVRPRDCTLDISLAQRLLRTPIHRLT